MTGVTSGLSGGLCESLRVVNVSECLVYDAGKFDAIMESLALESCDQESEVVSGRACFHSWAVKLDVTCVAERRRTSSAVEVRQCLQIICEDMAGP